MLQLSTCYLPLRTHGTNHRNSKVAAAEMQNSLFQYDSLSSQMNLSDHFYMFTQPDIIWFIKWVKCCKTDLTLAIQVCQENLAYLQTSDFWLIWLNINVNYFTKLCPTVSAKAIQLQNCLTLTVNSTNKCIPIFNYNSTIHKKFEVHCSFMTLATLWKT